MHDRLLLARVSIAINEIVDELLRALVLVDKTICEISTGA